VIAIIAASTSTEARRHPIITMRAIALGFAFTWVVWRFYVMWAVIHYDELLFRTGLLPWFYTHSLGVPRPVIFPATAVLYGLSGCERRSPIRVHRGIVVEGLRDSSDEAAAACIACPVPLHSRTQTTAG
jgi:hypothetical protein